MEDIHQQKKTDGPCSKASKLVLSWSMSFWGRGAFGGWEFYDAFVGGFVSLEMFFSFKTPDFC